MAGTYEERSEWKKTHLILLIFIILQQIETALTTRLCSSSSNSWVLSSVSSPTPQQHEQGIVVWEVLYDQDDVETKLTQNDQFILQGRLSNSIAFATSAMAQRERLLRT